MSDGGTHTYTDFTAVDNHFFCFPMSQIMSALHSCSDLAQSLSQPAALPLSLSLSHAYKAHIPTPPWLTHTAFIMYGAEIDE